MATLPVRQLGKVGVVTDANPYDLPANAFSNCSNVIFDEGRVQRAPVFKQLFDAVRSNLAYNDSTEDFVDSANTYQNVQGGATNSTRFISSYADPDQTEVVVVADKNNVIREYPNGQVNDVTPTTTALLVDNEETWSHAQVAGISFLSRRGMVPLGRVIGSDPQYGFISDSYGSPSVNSEWPSTDTCGVIRGFLDYAVCLNVTKDGVEYPTMVKWSNPLEFGTDPRSIGWDASNTNYIAGENVLADLRTPIRDGLTLGNVFIIYAQDQVWLMEYTGSSYVFNFRRLFPNGGIINTNCVVEVEGKHFVFGENDIYVHDGVSKQSIADGRVRRHIYKTLDRDTQRYAFVLHDSIANLVYFCYRTKQDEVSFAGSFYCNKAAVYNYREDTWSLMDLPNIVGGAESNVTLLESLYSQSTGSYELYNTPYTAFTGVTPKLPIMLGVSDPSLGLSDTRVYAIDLPTNGVVNLPAHPETIKEAFVERKGIDLDEQSGIRNYKIIKAIVPQSGFDSNNGDFIWKIGSTDIPNIDVQWYNTVVFSPDTQYKIDTKVAGRYLAYRISTDNVENFQISGFDAEVSEISKR